MERNHKELGKSVNMPQRKISCIENNRYEPGIDELKALCRFFNVSDDDLPGFTKPLPPKKKLRLPTV